MHLFDQAISARESKAAHRMRDYLAERAKSGEGRHLAALDGSYGYLRQFIPQVLDGVEFVGGTAATELLEAVRILRHLNATGARKVPDEAPTGFVPARWRGYLDTAAKSGNTSAYRHYWELCTLLALRDGLRTGDVFVHGSRRYSDPAAYLLTPSKWADHRVEFCRLVSKPTDAAAPRRCGHRISALRTVDLRAQSRRSTRTRPRARGPASTVLSPGFRRLVAVVTLWSTVVSPRNLLTVMTLNIKEGGDGRWADLTALIREAGPDLLLLQECRGWADDDYQRLASAESDLGMRALIAPSRSGFHTVVMSTGRLTWKAWETRYASELLHGFGVAVFALSNVTLPLSVISAHLTPYSAAAAAQEAQLLIARVYRRGGLGIMRATSTTSRWATRRPTGPGFRPTTCRRGRCLPSNRVVHPARTRSWEKRCARAV